MAVTSVDFAPRTFNYSDAAVFGRVTSAFQAYLDGRTEEAQAAEQMQKEYAPFSAIRSFFARRSTVMQLQALSDTQLADMGIERTQIEAIVARS